jgi:hypothetical protein
MRKQLLLGAFILGGILSVNAQGNSCANATAITTNGTLTNTTITGTYANPCWGGTNNQQDPATPLLANWYSYTPTANGLLTITSDLVANPGTTDSRLSVFTGTCAALTCYNGADDVNVAGNNFKTTLTIPVASGTTYYIAWDNNWSSAGFDFSVNFTASDCLSPNTLSVEDFTNITGNSATMTFGAAIGSPANYDIEVGTIGFTPGTDTGAEFTTSTTSADLTGLSTTNNAGLDVYVRGNCGATQGTWQGPFRLLLAADVPYANGFDTVGDMLNGFTVGTGWNVVTNAQVGQNVAHTPTGFSFTNTSTTAVADAWMFTRPLVLEANEQVTLTFVTRFLSSVATENASLVITQGSAATSATHTPIQTLTIPGGQPTVYTPQTVTFTAPAAGVYYIGFHHTSGTTGAVRSLLVDTIATTSTILGTNDAIASQFSVFPNPATNVINIANAENILVNGVEIVDINGRTVKSVKFDNVSEAQINISDLASGMYLVNISSDKGTTTKKIVKN